MRSYLSGEAGGAEWPSLPAAAGAEWPAAAGAEWPVAAGAEWPVALLAPPASGRTRHLRLVGTADPEDHAALGSVPAGSRREGVAPPVRRRRPASVAVRRRRLVLGAAVSALVLLALPLRATGGALSANAAASAPLGRRGPVTYVVRPGDTLWGIAERVDPSADPRPLVARLAAQVGSDTVVPGEQLRVP